MTKNILKLLSVLLSALILIGCGGSSSTQTEQSIDETQSSINNTTLSNENLTPPVLPTL
jgi:PBP1b-binding outer membrane lipoprotein LpoB